MLLQDFFAGARIHRVSNFFLPKSAVHYLYHLKSSFPYSNPRNHNIMIFLALHKIPKFNLIVCCGSFVETQNRPKLHILLKFKKRSFIEMTLQHGCSPVNLLHISKKFSQEHLCRASSVSLF